MSRDEWRTVRPWYMVGIALLICAAVAYSVDYLAGAILLMLASVFPTIGTFAFQCIRWRALFLRRQDPVPPEEDHSHL